MRSAWERKQTACLATIHHADRHVRPQVGIEQQPEVAPLPHHKPGLTYITHLSPSGTGFLTCAKAIPNQDLPKCGYCLSESTGATGTYHMHTMTS